VNYKVTQVYNDIIDNETWKLISHLVCNARITLLLSFILHIVTYNAASFTNVQNAKQYIYVIIKNLFHSKLIKIQRAGIQFIVNEFLRLYITPYNLATSKYNAKKGAGKSLRNPNKAWEA